MRRCRVGRPGIAIFLLKQSFNKRHQERFYRIEFARRDRVFAAKIVQDPDTFAAFNCLA